jgi:PAS domain S-box-containing protein
MNKKIIKNIIDKSIYPVIVTDTLGQITNVSEKSLDIFQYTRDKLLNLQIFAIFAGMKGLWNEIVYQSDINNDLENALIASMEFYGVVGGGKKIKCLIDIRVIRVADSVELVFFLKDVISENDLLFHMDDNRLYSNPLLFSVDQYKSILGNIPGIVYRCLLDADWTMVYISRMVEDFTGYSPDEFIGNSLRTFDSVIHPEDSENVVKAVMEGVENDKSYTMEYRIVHKNGSIRWVREHGRKVKGLQSGQDYLDGTILDISDLKKVESELYDAMVIANNAAETKANFLANMSHEIRTPMNSILGFLELGIESNKVPDDVLEYLKTANRSAKSLLRLINDILDLSKVEAGKLDIDDESFSLEQLFEDVVSVMKIKADEKGLELKTKIVAEIGCCRLGDSNRLKQVLLNIVSNAIKFTEVGSVLLEANGTNDSNVLNFSITDTGIGLSEDQLQGIFEPFVQADGSTSRKYGGTGLGTTISKQLVELMGGKIWIESVLGKGSVVHFYVLMDAVECEPVGINQKKIDVASGNLNAKVLVVEDVEENINLLNIRLKSKGCLVFKARNGKEAVEKFERDKYDIILMDIQMPIMDGYVATEEIRKLDGGDTIPIIALSASILEEDVQKCLDVGMNKVVGKPIDFKELFAVMEVFLPAVLSAENMVEVGNVSNELDWLELFVDIEKMIDVWGNQKIFLESLRSFVARYSGVIDSLKLKISSSPTDAKTLTHALKGVAGNLCFKDISDLICNIDECLKRKKLKEATELAVKLEELFADLILLVKERIGIANKHTVTETEITREGLHYLREFVVLCRENDPDLLESTFNQLENQLCQNDYNILRHYINEFDFSNAMAFADELINR